MSHNLPSTASLTPRASADAQDHVESRVTPQPPITPPFRTGILSTGLAAPQGGVFAAVGEQGVLVAALGDATATVTRIWSASPMVERRRAKTSVVRPARTLRSVGPLADHRLNLVRQGVDKRRQLVIAAIGAVVGGPPVLDLRNCNGATPRSSKRSKVGGVHPNMAEERAEGVEQTGGSLRAPDLYWKERRQLKAARLCARLYRRRVRAIEIPKAVDPMSPRPPAPSADQVRN